MIEITWLGHSVVRLRLDSGEVIVMDPWTEGNPKYPKDHTFDRLDTILLSHAHSDHMQGLIPLAKQFSAKVITMPETANWLKSKGVKTCAPMNKGGTQTVGAVRVTMVHAIHSSGIEDGDEMLYGGEPAGYVIHLQDNRAVYFAGDTNVFSDMQFIRQLYNPQLAFLPIGDHYTMGPKEAALACGLLRAPTVIPIHFGTFPMLTGTPAQLEQELKQEKGVRVWELEIGKPVQW